MLLVAFPLCKQPIAMGSFGRIHPKAVPLIFEELSLSDHVARDVLHCSDAAILNEVSSFCSLRSEVCGMIPKCQLGKASKLKERPGAR